MVAPQLQPLKVALGKAYPKVEMTTEQKRITELEEKLAEQELEL